MGQWAPKSMQMAKRRRRWCTIITQRNSLEENRRIVIHNEDTLTATRRSTFRARPSEPRMYGRVQCVRLREGYGKTPEAISRNCRTFTFQQRLNRHFSLAAWNHLAHANTCRTNRGDWKEETRTASCSNASLPRDMESRWQQQTGADGSSVRPKRQRVVKTTRQIKKEQNQNPNRTSNYLCGKSSVVVEVTLSSSEGSMGLRPEWPWRARKQRIPGLYESVQYSNLFLFPPPFATVCALPLFIRPMLRILK